MGLERQGQQSKGFGSEGSTVVDLDPDQREALRQLVQHGLSERERLVVLLTYSESLTAREIAGVLDLSEASVRRTQASILARLRAHMAWRGRDMADPAG